MSTSKTRRRGVVVGVLRYEVVSLPKVRFDGDRNPILRFKGDLRLLDAIERLAEIAEK